MPIIAVTAKALKDDREKCLEAGASDYLPKPVDTDKLLELIRQWTARWQQRAAAVREARSPWNNNRRHRTRARRRSEPRASILIVDDHPANLVALEAILAPLGHELVMARSGEEALRHILQREFALILLDVQMAGMNGFETAGLIKQHPRSRHIPIIFITAVSRDAAHVFRGYSQGAVDYLREAVRRRTSCARRRPCSSSCSCAARS